MSVIIPAYNCADTLAFAVESVFSDSCKDVEVVIINDGSTDKTARLMTTLEGLYEPHIRIAHQTNLGGNVARNRGLDLASGRYIQFLDADDRLMNNKLAMSVDAFRANTHLDCVYTDGCIGGNETLRIQASHENLFSIANNRFIEFTFGLNTNMPIFRRSFIEKSGERWDEKLSCWQESEYYFRLILAAESSNNILHIPEIGFSRTLSPQGIGRNQNTVRYIESKMEAILKIHRLCINKDLDNTQLQTQVDRFLWVLYKQCVLHEIDVLLPRIIAKHKSKTLFQKAIHNVHPSVIRRAYQFLFQIKKLLGRQE